MRFPLLLLLIAAAVPVAAQRSSDSEEGAPHAVRYDWSDYRAHSQNWAVTQSSEGLIYVANTWGVMEYDSGDWRLMPFSDEARTLARSLAVDGSGRLFVGGVGEFGRLVPDSVRSLRFESLRHAVPVAYRDFSDVWATHATPDGVVFQTPEYVFRWTERRMQVWRAGTRFHLSFLVGDRLFVREEGVGLRELRGDRMPVVPGGEAFADRRVFALMPHPRGLLAAVRDEGLWLLGGGRADSLASPATEYLRDFRPYGGRRVEAPGEPARFAVSTFGGGVVLFDAAGRLLRIHREDVGLAPDDWILGMAPDRQGGLWLALMDGVVRFDLDARMTEFGAREGLLGTVYSVERHAGVLYASTSLGVFRLVPGRSGRPGEPAAYSRFESLPTTDGSDPSQAWGLLSTGPDLLVATNGGTFRVAGDRLVPLTTGKTLRLGQIPGQDDLLLGEKEGIRVLRRTTRGWVADTAHVDVGGEITSFSTRGRDVWAGLVEGGVVRLSPTGDGFRMSYYDETDGLAPGPTSIVGWDAQLRVLQLGGVFGLTGDPLRFAPDPAYATLTNEYSLFNGVGGRMWLYRDDVLQTLSGPRFAMRIGWAQVETVFEEENGVVWIGTNDGLYRYDTRIAVPERAFPAFVRRVTDAQRNTLFGGVAADVAPDGEHLVVPHRLNSLRFEFASAAYSRPEGASYQFRLDGLDEPGVWSPWAPERSTNYTQLFEGTYTFRVRARDAYGRISDEASFTIRVLPPWYRTVWAYLAYVLAIGLALWGLVSWQTRAQRVRAETERARAARLHRLGARLRETNARLRHEEKLKDDLLANASHELRTPLTAILGFSELLVEEVPEESRDLAETIHRGGARMLGTVDGLLDMHKLQSGTLDVFPEALDAADVARQTARSLMSLAAGRGLTLRVLPETLAVPATTDRGGLDRILTHLIGNAIKFTESGGVDVLVDADDDTLHLSVRDTGIGIPQDMLETVFEPFEQVSTGHGRSHEGTGLGLAIVRRLVALMGGTVHLESTVGQGTTVRVSLPRVLSTVTQRRVVVGGQNPALAGAHVFALCLTDDEERDLRAWMEPAGRVLTAGSVGEARRRLRRTTCDVVFVASSDHEVEIVRHLRRVPGYEHTPFVRVGGVPLEVAALAERGFAFEVARPLVSDAVVPLVETVLNHVEAAEPVGAMAV